jgi:hypothetical protein
MLARYGFLYMQYRGSCSWWIAWIQLKILILTLFLVFLQRLYFVQLYLVLLTSIVAVASHSAYKPFLHQSMDKLESAMLYVQVVFIATVLDQQG